jgi:hypothetical protein
MALLRKNTESFKRLKEALMWRFCIKKFQPTSYSNIPYTFTKASILQIENYLKEKQMMTGKRKLSGIYARSIACNWFLEVKKLILSSIMAITVWWRNQAF